MTIANLDQFYDALTNNSSRIFIDKASLASQTANSYCSFWRQTGQPAQGGIPSTASTCNNTTVGTMGFTQQTSPATSSLGWLSMQTSVANQTPEIHDRLAHMGGLNGTLTTAQTVNLDLNSLLGTDNIASRIGDSNYSDVTWWLEWYTATGATAVTITINVTYNDGTTGNLTAISLAATRPAGHLIPLNSFIPAGTAKFIRGVNTATLSATTGTAGSFGITCSRNRSLLDKHFIANKGEVYTWDELGSPEIYNSSCLWLLMFTTGTTAGTLRGQGKLAHG